MLLCIALQTGHSNINLSIRVRIVNISFDSERCSTSLIFAYCSVSFANTLILSRNVPLRTVLLKKSIINNLMIIQSCYGFCPCDIKPAPVDQVVVRVDRLVVFLLVFESLDTLPHRRQCIRWRVHRRIFRHRLALDLYMSSF